ncbi:MAG: Asp-tRNA(Asn)/Glu-tRNA(Gln) amidotransferase GatCAB subunit C [Selenomonadales bacterium]|jgi:aspartate--tRNA ligase|nr:MAG: Asp-tRNA(Asn)/Glu-tRNA(Gln) amidotransferase GatCAB subunit C [Selenomonadales bacterium]
MKRTHYCGALTEEEVGKRVTVCGWVQTKRDMGGVIFIDLRDREGTLQTVFDARLLTEEDFKLAEGVRNQSVVQITGIMRIRDEETYNPRLKTGTIELAAESIFLLSEAAPLPFPMEDGFPVREELRLKYRYLDLRRPCVQENLRFRSRVQSVIRRFLEKEGFIEVETPMLTKSTPEGARDYLVPSRVHPGEFYALPQSPQLFKQLLMVGGLDKYYQFARCFRDEDLRADRQPEFTQVDMELSFAEQEDILRHLEKLFKELFRECMGMELPAFKRMTWLEAMELYGSDKPDLRFDMPIYELSDIAQNCSFSLFRQAVQAGGKLRALCVKGGASYSRTQIEELTQKALSLGAKGMAWISVQPDGSYYSILTKFMSRDELNEIVLRVKAEPGDFILFCADSLETVRRVLGGLRLEIARELKLIAPDRFEFLIVTDFPQFEYSHEEKRYISAHHPFTMPREEDIDKLKSEPEKVRAQAYDVVLNGVELGSGSIRIHDWRIQKLMFEALGFTEEQLKERFGFFLEAFKYGAPPHGGFAFGLDRLVMLMLGADSLREVIAFPKNKEAVCVMTGAPDYVDDEQLDALGLNKMEQTSVKAGRKASVKMDLDNIAMLARLNIPPEERGRLERDMQDIINMAGRLEEIETDREMVNISGLVNVMRPDEPGSAWERDSLLENAPTKTEQYILVPRVIE